MRTLGLSALLFAGCLPPEKPTSSAITKAAPIATKAVSVAEVTAKLRTALALVELELREQRPSQFIGTGKGPDYVPLPFQVTVEADGTIRYQSGPPGTFSLKGSITPAGKHRNEHGFDEFKQSKHLQKLNRNGVC